MRRRPNKRKNFDNKTYKEEHHPPHSLSQGNVIAFTTGPNTFSHF